MSKSTSHCLYISETEEACRKKAEFEILGMPSPKDPYSDITQACLNHVGHLLGTPEGAIENESWLVIPLVGDEQ